jgi:polyhydroxybutyrate depolymerase
MVVRAAAVFAVLVGLVAAGCRPGGSRADPATSVPVGTSSRTVTVDGRDRTVHVYRPASVNGSTPVPLVVMLHGGFGSGGQAEKAYGWDRLADTAGFVVAYPDGVDRAWAVGGGCCGVPGRTGVDDPTFLVRAVEDLRGALPIDPRRVYATGISNGGLLAYRIACDTTVFAAIGPVAATLLGPCDRPAPISIIHIHGAADERVRYDGGRGNGVAAIDGPAVPDLIERWRRTDGCAPPASQVEDPVTTSVADCPDGRAVELITIAGAGHQWPGAGPRTVGERALGLDPPSSALDATVTLWEFFAAHPRPA